MSRRKTIEEKRAQQERIEQEKALTRYCLSRHRQKDSWDQIEAVLDGKYFVGSEKDDDRGNLVKKIETCRKKMFDSTAEDFSRLVRACRRSKLLDPARRPLSGYIVGLNNCYIAGLASLAVYGSEWIRPPEDWKINTHNDRRQFSSLARHLLARYKEVPLFLDAAWFSGNPKYQDWFIQLGRGQNIRKQHGLPISMTKRMAHEWLSAPDSLSINQAFRWSQILGSDGDERVARAVCSSRLGDSFGEDEFWMTVIRFFIANPMLDTVQYGPLIDYISHQKFQPAGEQIVNGQRVQLPPPEPGFSMKGRSAQALLSRMEQWHKQLGKKKKSYKEWKSCGVPGITIEEGRENDKTVWTISEILNSTELFKEGKAQRHCVASYESSCAAGRIAIYSMRVLRPSCPLERALTIELSNRVVVQARGHCNRPPTQLENRILRLWTQKRGIAVRTYI